MIRDILCDSDCIYQEKGLCEKQNDITMSFLNGLSIMVECSDYLARKVESRLDRIVSICCGEAVVVRSDTTPLSPATEELCYTVNWYECVKCGNTCNTKQQEVTE